MIDAMMAFWEAFGFGVFLIFIGAMRCILMSKK